jgi:hypothetical protein
MKPYRRHLGRAATGLPSQVRDQLVNLFFDDAVAAADAPYRRLVAAHPQCPSRHLEQFGRDTEPEVRAAVATNPACPVPLLGQLLQDPYSQVSRAAADNPSCPPYLRALWQLVQGQQAPPSAGTPGRTAAVPVQAGRRANQYTRRPACLAPAPALLLRQARAGSPAHQPAR